MFRFAPLLLLILECLISSGMAQENRKIEPNLSEAPSSLELFAPGLISTDLYERDMAISPNGKEIIYTLGDYRQSKRCLVTIKKNGETWSEPAILPISGKYQDIEPFFSPDGTRLFFASNRPLKEGSDRTDYNIWYSERQGQTWGTPQALNEMINTEKNEFYPSLSLNGNLYFTATREEGPGREDIYVSTWENGSYQNPRPLDTLVNTPYYEFNAYISPEEDLLVFSSYGRPDGLGGGDLYYSRKQKDGSWSRAKNMGEGINSPKLDYCPFVDMAQGNFYFTSERVSSEEGTFSEVKDFIEYAHRLQNGMGNIYRIGWEKTGLK